MSSTIRKNFNDPIFEYSKVNYTNKSAIVTLKVQNESMFIALNNERNKQWMIQHVRIQTGKKTDISITLAPNDFIIDLFLDGTGSHCIVTTNNGENFYIHLKTLKPVNLKKAKGHIITAIGWNIEYGTNTDTSFILIGTTTGSIFETNISSNGTVQYFKLLTETISTNKSSPISDISLSMVTIVAKSDKWVAFICYPGQLHILSTTMNTVESLQQQSGTFVGVITESNAILTTMFSSKESHRHRYVNQGPKSCSSFSLNSAESGVAPTRYFWANEDGISIGSVDVAKDVEGYDLIEEQGFIKHERHNGLMNYPIMIEMSEFHVIALYRNQIIAYSAYNYKKYFEKAFEDSAIKAIGISRDTSSQMLWVYTNQSMWKYKPNNEKRIYVIFNYQPLKRTAILTLWLDSLHNNDLQKTQKDSTLFLKTKLDTSNANFNSQKDYGIKNETKISNNSTLSLHISAYENSIFASGDNPGVEKDETNKKKENILSIKSLKASVKHLQYAFELPRQQQDQKKNDPEVMQFKASQQLSNVNAAPSSSDKKYVWKVFMNAGDFEKARLLTQSMEDQGPFQLVVKKQADHYFVAEEYTVAAKYYFESEEAFDAVVLKFMTQQTSIKRKGLKVYLMLRLEIDSDPVRFTLLVWWILEISLSQLAEARKNAAGDTVAVEELKKELNEFLQKALVLQCLKENKEAAYKLVISHLDFDTHIILSKLLKDYETLIRILLLQNKFSDALSVINERSRPSLFYKFAPEILPQIPLKFFEVILKNDNILDPSQLLPAFYKSIGNPELYAIAFKYFSHVVDAERGNKSIHAFLILLYAEYRPNLLLEYLKKWSNTGIMGEPAYDAGNALRLCIRKNLKNCCVFLYQLEGMYESAVKYALEISLDLAKECAKQVGEEKSDTDHLLSSFDDSAISSSEEVQKHVWLTIARHMIKNDASTADVMKLIKESGNVVNVDDLLPLFPEFTSIEALQGPLCDCLKEKSEKIQDVQKSIKEASELAESIKRDIETRQKTYRIVKISDKCFRCNGNLFQKPFYAFNCWHYLHSDCCEEILLGLFNQDEIKYYNSCKDAYQKLSKQYIREEDGGIKIKLDLIKRKIGEMLSDDCPLCGKRVINLIDQPFYTEKEYELEMEKWKI